MMKTHFAKVTERPGGVIRTSTLCGRMSDRSADGINSAENANGVTCAFCLRKLEARTGRQVEQTEIVE